MKKRSLKIWRHFYASSAYRTLSFLLEKMGFKKIASVCFELSFVMEFRERFGHKFDKVYYKLCGGVFLVPVFYITLSWLVGEGILWFLPFLYFSLNFGWCFMLASIDLDKMFATHALLLLERNSPYLQIAFPTKEHLQNMLNNPLLVSDRNSLTLLYQAKESWEYLQLLEKIGSPVIMDAVEALKKNDSSEFERIIHERFPEIYDKIYTRFSPLRVQHESVLYVIKKEDYAEYLSIWIKAFDNHSALIEKESVGSLCVTESGEIVQNDQEEDDE